MSDEIPAIADYVPEYQVLDGDKISIDAILNIPLTFTGWMFGKSKFTNNGGERLTLQFILDGHQRVAFTSSNVLIEQVRAFEKACPGKQFTGTIRKVGKCYKFVK